MTPEAHTAYIVSCIREAASMYPQDAAAFLAEHDAHRRAEEFAELARLFDDRGRSLLDGGIMTAADAAQLIRRHTSGKDTGDATQAPAGESTQQAATEAPPTDGPWWQTIADALNTAAAAGTHIGIDVDGVLTDHLTRAIVWDRDTERWTVACADCDRQLVDCGHCPTCETCLDCGICSGVGCTCKCEAAQAEPAPGFFQVGHGYTHRDGSDFLCVAVTTHPLTGEPRALGWIIRSGWHDAGALDPDDWAHAYDGCEPPESEDRRD